MRPLPALYPSEEKYIDDPMLVVLRLVAEAVG
jgi:hypothetical protein